MFSLFSCGGERICDAGATQQCLCSAETKGVQKCRKNGESWGKCKCDDGEASVSSKPNKSKKRSSSRSNLQQLRSSSDYEVQWDSSQSVWVICLSALKTRESAEKSVRKYQKEGVSAHLLWIPDYASTSQAERYLVYVGPYPYRGSDRSGIKSKLQEIQDSIIDSAYAIRLDQNPSEELIK